MLTALRRKDLKSSIRRKGFPKPTRVPVVSATGPRHLGTEGVEQVEECPGLNDDVGHRGIRNHHLSSITDP